MERAKANHPQDLITLTSGPFWHFVPMIKGLSRDVPRTVQVPFLLGSGTCEQHRHEYPAKESHVRFHHTLSQYLGAGRSSCNITLMPIDDFTFC